VVCTWVMLAGMVGSAFWVDWAVPTFCAKADASETILTFNCIERVVFSYIFCFIALTVALLPPHTTNPWECLFIKVPVPTRVVKFGLQVAAAAAFAVALNKANSELADKIYRDVFPRVKICDVKPFTAHHVKVFAGVECTPEWPSWVDGKFSLGVVVTEGLHVFALNFAAGIILPKVGVLVPVVLPCLVITAIRSRFSITPGPALNLIPATAGAVLHGGLDAWRAHALGCGLGMTLAYLAQMRLLHIAGEFTSAWSFRIPDQFEVEGKEGPKKTSRSAAGGKKKAEEFASKKKANEEFDPNSVGTGDFIIKGVTAHNSVSGAKGKKD